MTRAAFMVTCLHYTGQPPERIPTSKPGRAFIGWGCPTVFKTTTCHFLYELFCGPKCELSSHAESICATETWHRANFDVHDSESLSCVWRAAGAGPYQKNFKSFVCTLSIRGLQLEMLLEDTCTPSSQHLLLMLRLFGESFPEVR